MEWTEGFLTGVRPPYGGLTLMWWSDPLLGLIGSDPINMVWHRGGLLGDELAGAGGDPAQEPFKGGKIH